MFQANVVEKNQTYSMSHNIFPHDRAVYEITWENMVDIDRPQTTIEYGACALHAGCLTLQTHTQNM